MSDLTIRAGYMCATNEYWKKQYRGSKGDLYTVEFAFRPFGQIEYDYSCTCPQNKFLKKECKHIAQAQAERCGWHQQMEGGDVDSNDPKCPKCGGPVIAIQWGE